MKLRDAVDALYDVQDRPGVRAVINFFEDLERYGPGGYFYEDIDGLYFSQEESDDDPIVDELYSIDLDAEYDDFF